MEHPRFTKAEIIRTGQEMYDQRFRPLLEADKNLRKVTSYWTTRPRRSELDTDPATSKPSCAGATSLIENQTPCVSATMQCIGLSVYDPIRKL